MVSQAVMVKQLCHGEPVEPRHLLKSWFDGLTMTTPDVLTVTALAPSTLHAMDLVTGITGLVGSHVALELLASERTVHGLVRPRSDRGIVRKVFNHHRRDGNALFDRIVWVECDLLDAIGLREAMNGAEHVFHCAGLVSFDPRDAKRMFATNIGGTANVVNAALECGVRKLVHVSSTAATGRAGTGEPVTEDMPWVRDKLTSPYAVSKYEGEMEVQRAVAEGLDAVIVNPSVVLGAGARGRPMSGLSLRCGDN